MVEFYQHDVNSGALPGEWDTVKFQKTKKRIEKRTFEWLYIWRFSVKIRKKIFFTTLVCMRPLSFSLANLFKQKPCLYNPHQNMASKLKILKKHNKFVRKTPIVFSKQNDNVEHALLIINSNRITNAEFCREIWKKCPWMRTKLDWLRNLQNKNLFGLFSLFLVRKSLY